MVQSTKLNLTDKRYSVLGPVDPQRSQRQRRLANTRMRTTHQSPQQESHMHTGVMSFS